MALMMVRLVRMMMTNIMIIMELHNLIQPRCSSSRA